MKDVKKNKLNLFFSAFLIIGFVICSYFFSSMASQMSMTAGKWITFLILLLFGLLLFYATRVGEGKQVKRFSLFVLLLVDLPALYIILATMLSALPLHEALSSQMTVSMIAAVALGYGIPYTFLSGYELKVDEENAEPINGGIAQELKDLDEIDEISENASDEFSQEDLEDTPAEVSDELTEESSDEISTDVEEISEEETSEE